MLSFIIFNMVLEEITSISNVSNLCLTCYSLPSLCCKQVNMPIMSVSARNCCLDSFSKSFRSQLGALFIHMIYYDKQVFIHNTYPPDSHLLRYKNTQILIFKNKSQVIRSELLIFYLNNAYFSFFYFICSMKYTWENLLKIAMFCREHYAVICVYSRYVHVLLCPRAGPRSLIGRIVILVVILKYSLSKYLCSCNVCNIFINIINLYLIYYWRINYKNE